MKAEVSLIEDDGTMLHDRFEISLTEKVNGNWLADLINKGLTEYANRQSLPTEQREGE